MTNVFDIHSMFESQFEPDGDGFLYRRNSKDAPIRVSAAERDKYIGIFARHVKYGFWGIVISTSLLIAALTTYNIITGDEPSNIVLYIGLTIIFLAYMFAHIRARNLPARELRDRLIVGPPRSKTQIRNRHAANMSYSQIGGVILIGFAFPAVCIRKYGIQSVWSILSLA